MKRYSAELNLINEAAYMMENPLGKWCKFADHEAELAAVREQKAELLKALIEARELVSGWADYADEYFKTKHRLTDDLAMLDAAINKAREGE